MGNVYGCVRVSSIDRNEDGQLVIMEENIVSKGNVYIDKQSGKDFERSQYKKLVEKLKAETCYTYSALIVWDEIMRICKSSGVYSLKSLALIFV